jgi:hypothetical protein
MGNDNHVVITHKLCGFQGRLGGCVVMMKEPFVVVPKFRSFSSHIFSHASQNITVKVRVDHSVRRNKFTVNNPLHVEKTVRMLFIELRTCCASFLLVIVGSSCVKFVALFLDHSCKSNFRHSLSS